MQRNQKFAVSMLAFLILLAIVTWSLENIKNEDEFKCSIYSDIIELVPNEKNVRAGSLILSGQLPIEKIFFSSRNAVFKIPNLTIDKEKTNIDKLVKEKPGQDIEIVLPLEKKAWVELQIHDRQTNISSLKIIPDQDKDLRFNIERSGDVVKLYITPEYVSKMEFDLQAFQFMTEEEFEVSYGIHSKLTLRGAPNDPKIISGRTSDFPLKAELIFQDKKSTEDFIIYLGHKPSTEKMPMVPLSLEATELIDKIRFINSKKGQINIFGNKFIDIEKNLHSPADIEIKTGIEGLKDFRLGSPGILTAIRSKSEEILIDNENQARSMLDIFLQQKWLVIVSGFFLIVIDKWILILVAK